MSNQFVCCNDCYEILEKIHPDAANLWIELCSLQLSNGGIVECQNDLPELRKLEILGYITTTETEKNILILTRGQIMSEDGQNFFCSRDGNHD